MSKRPEMWLVMCGPPVPPFVVFTEEEAETRARAGQAVWRVSGLERVRPTAEVPEGWLDGCTCTEEGCPG